MNAPLFLNIRVRHVAKSRHFFDALGFPFNDHYSNEEAACMVINNNAYIMLLSPGFFGQHTHLPAANPLETAAAIVGIQRPSKEAVNKLVEKALFLGAQECRPMYDHGFMYGRTFSDPDGHIWEIFWMEAQQQQQQQQ